MKLLINTATTSKGGGVQVALSFIDECKKYPEHQFHVILAENIIGSIEEERYPQNFNFYRIGYRPAKRVFSFKTRTQLFRTLEDNIQPDAVFTTTGPAYWRPQAPHLVGYNLPHYIYPESPYFQKISLSKKMKWKLKGCLLKYFFKKEADAFVVQTDDVNKRLRKWINGGNVYTVTNTFGSHFFEHKQVKNKLPKPRKEEFRFLTLSSFYPHKNFGIFRNIIDFLGSEGNHKIRFVVTLPKADFNREFPNKYREFIYNTGPIPVDECPSLYQECDAMFLPTLLECFSASYPEAMVMKKPILTSNLAFARSICKDAALYFHPLNAKEAAEKMLELNENEKMRLTLAQKGKKRLKELDTSQQRAKKYLDICKNLSDAR